MQKQIPHWPVGESSLSASPPGHLPLPAGTFQKSSAFTPQKCQGAPGGHQRPSGAPSSGQGPLLPLLRAAGQCIRSLRPFCNFWLHSPKKPAFISRLLLSDGPSPGSITNTITAVTLLFCYSHRGSKKFSTERRSSMHSQNK